MLPINSLVRNAAAVFAIAGGTLLTPAAATAGYTPGVYGSDASVGSISLSALGTPVGGTPVGEVSGAGSPAYSQQQMVLGTSATVALPVVPGVTPLEIVLNTPGSKTRVAGHRITDNGGYHAVGQSFNRTTTLSVKSANPLLPLNLLTVGTGFLTTTAIADISTAGVQTNTTLAKTSGLTISGLLIGAPIKLTGVLKPGVIFSSALITITADEVSTGKSHGLDLGRINALDIVFHGAVVPGMPLTGHILLGSASAY